MSGFKWCVGRDATCIDKIHSRFFVCFVYSLSSTVDCSCSFVCHHHTACFVIKKRMKHTWTRRRNNWQSKCNNICLCGRWENAPVAPAYLSVKVWHIEKTEAILLLTSQIWSCDILDRMIQTNTIMIRKLELIFTSDYTQYIVTLKFIFTME